MSDQQADDSERIRAIGSTVSCRRAALRPSGRGSCRLTRRRVRPPVLPRAARRRRVDRAGAATRADRVRAAAVRERRRLLRSHGAPGAGDSRALRRARHHRAAGSRRRDAAGAPRRGERHANTPRSTARRSRSSRSCSGADAELASAEYVPYRLAFDVEKLTWELDFFVTHFLEGYRGVRAVGRRERAALAEEWQAHRGGARRRTTRALPSRLSQPEPDAARRPAATSSTSRMRGWDPTPTISCRCCAIPTSTSPSASSTI